MFLWLAGIAVCMLVWGAVWQRNLLMAFGVLIGVLAAWLLSYSIEPYVTGMESIPLWLPPLPLATVAVLLIGYGVLVWIRGNEGLPDKRSKRTDDSH